MNLSILFGISLLLPLALFIVASLLQNDSLAQTAAYASLPFWGICLWAFIGNLRSSQNRSRRPETKLAQIKNSLNSLQTLPEHTLEFKDSTGTTNQIRFIDETFMLNNSPSTVPDLEAALMAAKPFSIKISRDTP